MSDRRRDLLNMAAQLRTTADRLEAAAGGEDDQAEVATALEQLRAHTATLEGAEFATVEPPAPEDSAAPADGA